MVFQAGIKILTFTIIAIYILFCTFMLCDLHGVSYSILTVTPLFLINLPILFSAIFISTIILTLLSLVVKKSILFTIITLMLYFTVFYFPFFTLKFSIYNDQLGFAIETFYGYATGYIEPYQGELTTLGHAFFTAIFGKVLGLDLYSVVKCVEALFVLVCFLAYLSLIVRFIKKNVADSNASLLAIATILMFPAFALEPLVYSRGYFGLVLSVILLMCTFTFIESGKISNSIVLTIVFIASSISYPLQPLILIFSMLLLLFIFWFLRLLRKDVMHLNLGSLTYKTLYFFVIWAFIQVFYGKGSWVVFREIILNALKQEYFTAFETFIALRYVGDALLYSNLRIIMMIAAWILSALIALILLIKVLRQSISHVELFALSIIGAILLLGFIYGAMFHEPALRFYRTLVAIMPFTLTHFINHGKAKNPFKFKKVLITLLLSTLAVFLMLSPITKWGWIFIGYPTTNDVKLAEYITSHSVTSLYTYVYAPGSHQLLSFMFTINAISAGEIGRWTIRGGDIEFNLDTAVLSTYTATFYRIYILPRWTGIDIKVMLHEIYDFAASNNLVYSNSDLYLLIEKL